MNADNYVLEVTWKVGESEILYIVKSKQKLAEIVQLLSQSNNYDLLSINCLGETGDLGELEMGLIDETLSEDLELG